MAALERDRVVKFRWFIILALFLAGCAGKPDRTQAPWDPAKPTQRALRWLPISQQAGQAWGVSPRLITAIIAVESGGNPNLVSKSNAVGLMQIKASTAGKDVWRHMGWRGQPSNSELKNPQRNISTGTAYLSILEHGILSGIKDPQTMQYALIISYANGAGALLRTFSSNRKRAIEKINGMSPEEFREYIADNHPAAQAPRYLWKVTRAMDEI
ncbi:membrane-bound lytic murein transglycosylase E [Shimwellia blattae DSM 4481 = NBRC 105725]|uniref:Endo-type membrane-bound lytic murein transglycosylase A n=1 Tax=Shimwellia blattae (strain ATCC 29907 / DSM 4481 / JCM 1650 / NBRC 105725 / CDC 9005-74) TaxID=630626 RepID=I2B8N2_SHIBC|nr:membrane-bound lytic murein transglycosylase E [Shimwellia blattae DSM 4481 = NBRC 105725]VEC22488.1 Endo-type membrane-bound lytic murein transglycosylase A precursor [Shimwellia blattae]